MGWPQNDPTANPSLSPAAQVGKRLKMIYEQLLEGFERDTYSFENVYREHPIVMQQVNGMVSRSVASTHDANHARRRYLT